VPELDVAAAIRAAAEGTSGTAAAELVELHGDVGCGSATL
jgi:hypothetical protein